MLITRETHKDLNQLKKDLEQACTAHSFGVLGVHDLQAKLREKGQEFDRACLVFDVCNPVAAKRALEADPRISTVLPCRISVYETEPGAYALMMVRPSKLLDLFGSEELGELGREIEEKLEAILDQTVA